MCCDSYNDEFSQEELDSAASCPECGGAVDEDGYTMESCCNYSPVVCDICGHSPCDQSC